MPSSAALFIRRLQPSKCRPSTLARIQIERPAYPFAANGFGAFPARIAAHRFIAAALSFALCAGDMPPFFFGAAAGASALATTGALSFAHRAC